MCDSTTKKNPVGGTLDTLVITPEKQLQKRAKRKVISHTQALRMAELNSKLFDQYEQTRWCAYHVKEVNGKLVTNYCKKRWCAVCSANKQAEMINGYQEAVAGMEEPYFVTLTVPAVKGEPLKATMKGMIKTFTKIKDRLRKQGIKISGIRKLECNFNPKKKTFNPHFHLLIDGDIEAKAVYHYWLQHNTEAEPEAQDIQPAQEGSFKELVKYTTKTVVNERFYPEAQDIIYRALEKVRTFQPYGNIRKAQEAPQAPETAENEEPDTTPTPEAESPIQEENTPKTYHWNPYQNTWVNTEGVQLVEVQLSEKTARVVQNIRKAPLYIFYLTE